MKKISLPDQREIDCETNSPVSSGLLSLQLDLPMACGGSGLCATCHVFVEEGSENLSPIEEREQRALNNLTNRKPNSRLSCQARVLGDVTVKIPEGDYIQSAAELEAMIGKRAGRDVLHAIDGRLLVARGQIISKYVINQIRRTLG